MARLTEEEIKKRLLQLQEWRLEDQKWIIKKYRFMHFLTGISFVKEIADLSETVNHHPFISIDYKVVTLKLSSWQAQGITELDFDLAAKYDQIYSKTTGTKKGGDLS